MADAKKIVEFNLEELLEAFKSNLQTMDSQEMVQLSKDLLYIRYYLTALSMKSLLASEEFTELLAHLQAELKKPTLAKSGVSDREMVQ